MTTDPAPTRPPPKEKPHFDIEISCGGVVIMTHSFEPIKLNDVLIAIETATGKKIK